MGKSLHTLLVAYLHVYFCQFENIKMWVHVVVEKLLNYASNLAEI
jgi:hypothetical protein